MPIYEYYCPDNNRIYQFYAKTLAQGQIIPKCPDNPAFRMQKVLSRFAVNTGGKTDDFGPPAGGMPGAPGMDGADDPRMEAAMGAMEREFANVDENDPRAMGRMMRRMAELTGEKIDGEMEEVVRKLEEGADPDSLEDQLGGGDSEAAGGGDPYGMEGGVPPGGADPSTTAAKEARARLRSRTASPSRDPKLYDYD